MYVQIGDDRAVCFNMSMKQQPIKVLLNQTLNSQELAFEVQTDIVSHARPRLDKVYALFSYQAVSLIFTTEIMLRLKVWN